MARRIRQSRSGCIQGRTEPLYPARKRLQGAPSPSSAASAFRRARRKKRARPQNLDGDYKIILEPTRKIKKDWIEYDKVKWEMEEGISQLVEKLLKENSMSFEDKVLEVYKYICLNYVYDANVLYFFKRDDSDKDNIKYIAVDWYGRIVGQDWIKRRQKHNRRICYEFARFYAKAINVLLGENDKLEAVLLGDKENLHYVVGLTGEEYSIILDLDDFNSIKDLTRVKFGLTIKGIKILRDDSKKFQKVVEKFNNGKRDELLEIEDAKRNLEKKSLIEYFDEVVKILKSKNIDAQGFFEYIRSIIEKEGIEIEKIWKEDKDAPEKRYERCFIFKINEKTYLVDSIKKELVEVKKEKLDKKIFIFNPSENMYLYYGG